MKKKILFGLLFGVMLIGLTGCGNNSSKYSLGDKVSTDIVEFTIENAKLALSLDSEGNVKDYVEPNNYKYIVAKGHVYAGLTLIVKNLDRTELNISNDFITVKYNKNKSNELEIISSSEDLAKWDETSKISLLNSNDELTYKAYIDLDCEAEDLEDDFEVIVVLPKSDGSTEKYNFLITKSSRENNIVREISLETAIERYPLTATEEYFEKHLNEFETLNDTELTEFIKSNDGKHYIKFKDDTELIKFINSNPHVKFKKKYRHYDFLENKNSQGRNLRIWGIGTDAASLMWSMNEWSVEGNTLIINSGKYLVKKINDTNYYLLIYKTSNSLAGLMYK